MKRMIQLFRIQALEFAQTNWWVFVLFIGALTCIVFTSSGHLLEIVPVFLVHFVADIMIMMMFIEYTSGNSKNGTLLQIVSTGLFLSLKIHSGIIHSSWQYLAADVLYILAAIKNYQHDIHRTEIRWINTKSALVISALVIGTIYVPNHLITSLSQWIQVTGIFTFAVALMQIQNKNYRYYLSLLGLLGMFLGSGLECYRTFEQGEVFGLALSYFILPTTVFVFYLKQWSFYSKPQALAA